MSIFESIWNLIVHIFRQAKPRKVIPVRFNKQIVAGGFQYHSTKNKSKAAKIIKQFRSAGFNCYSHELNELVADRTNGISRDEVLKLLRQNVDDMLPFVEECAYNGMIFRCIFWNSNSDVGRKLSASDIISIFEYAWGRWQEFRNWILWTPVSETDDDLADDKRRAIIAHIEGKVDRDKTVRMAGAEGKDYVFTETHIQRVDEIGRGLPATWKSIVVTDSGGVLGRMTDSVFRPTKAYPAICEMVARNHIVRGYSFDLYWFCEPTDGGVDETIKRVGAIAKEKGIA